MSELVFFEETAMASISETNFGQSRKSRRRQLSNFSKWQTRMVTLVNSSLGPKLTVFAENLIKSFAGQRLGELLNFCLLVVSCSTDGASQVKIRNLGHVCSHLAQSSVFNSMILTFPVLSLRNPLATERPGTCTCIKRLDSGLQGYWCIRTTAMSHDTIEKLAIAHTETSNHIEDKYHTSDDKYHYRMPPPNKWSRIRSMLREPFAEFLGTLILILFGTSVDCQVFLSMDSSVVSTTRGDYLSLNFGWAVGVAFGVWISAGISGGHVNPAVTVALAAFREFPWKKVPIYILAQLLGAICGAAITYANYFHAINVVEGGPGIRTITGSGDLFGAYSLSILSPLSCFFSEFMGTAVLMIGVLASTDKGNGPPPAGLLPVSIFILVLGLGAAMGMNTGYALNPARDLGPRILTAIVGYGRAVFDYRNQYWLWCPLLGPVCGALFGALIYDLLIYTGGDSIVNKIDIQTISGENLPPIQITREFA